MRKFVFLMSMCLIVSASPDAGAEIIDRIVARVNKQVVTQYDVKRAALPYLLQNGRNPAEIKGPNQKKLLAEVLEDLVDRKLMLIEAKKIELKISDAELDQWLAFTRSQQKLSEEQFQAIIAQYGMDFDDYREMVRENLLKIRMIKIKVGSQVSISDAEVDEEYRTRFGDPNAKQPYVEVSHVLLRPKADTPEAHKEARGRALQARKRIRAGEEFGLVAEQMSDGPTATKKGYLGWYRPGELDPDFEKAAFRIKPGKTSGVVKTKFGYHIIHVAAVEQRVPPNVEERKDEVRGYLTQKGMERLLKQYLKQLRERAFVDIHD